jgi:hypothetical protein
MNKLLKEEISVLIIEEDLGSMVTSLRNVMEKFAHYDQVSVAKRKRVAAPFLHGNLAG